MLARIHLTVLHGRSAAVMLSEPQSTPYDLHFELFGTRVRIHPFFWLFNAILGWSAMERGFLYLLIWIAAVLFRSSGFSAPPGWGRPVSFASWRA